MLWWLSDWTEYCDKSVSTEWNAGPPVRSEGFLPCIQSVRSFRHVRLFATPWTAACQASLSITNSQSLLQLMSIKSVMPSNHLILCRPLLLLPSILFTIRVFSNVGQFFTSGGQSIGASASASVLPMNTQDWLTGLIFLQSKGLLRVFSNTTVQKHQFFVAQLSLWSSSHIHTRLLDRVFIECLQSEKNSEGHYLYELPRRLPKPSTTTTHLFS